MYKTIRAICLYLFGVTVFFLAFAPSAQAGRSTNVVLNKATLESGYTVHNTTGTFEVGIPPHGITQVKKLRVHLRKAKLKRYSTANETLLSDLYVYQLRSAKKFALHKKVWIKLSYPAVNMSTDKVIKYWDASASTWRPLRTTDNQTTLQVAASTKHKNVVLGVFEKKAQATGNVISGLASWYDGVGAASNDFPMNTRIRVTNTTTGQFVDSTVVSTGPFVSGRVVDLTREDFSAIADLSTGVIPVTVQKVE